MTDKLFLVQYGDDEDNITFDLGVFATFDLAKRAAEVHNEERHSTMNPVTGRHLQLFDYYDVTTLDLNRLYQVFEVPPTVVVIDNREHNNRMREEKPWQKHRDTGSQP